MLELWTLLGAYRDALTLVGGSAPPLLIGETPDDPYVGTLDVDVVIDPLGVPDQTYRSIAERLHERGYVQGSQPFRWFRTVEIDGQEIVVEVDLLAPVTTTTGRSHRHERIEGAALARRTAGTELVRDAFVELPLEGQLPDGRPNRVNLRVATVAVVVVLKALAIGERDKASDSYAIDYLLAHVPGGPGAIAEEIRRLPNVEPVTRGLAVLADKFSTVDSYGPSSVAAYRRLAPGSAEAEQAQAVAYARVQRLLSGARGP
jgi:hypothetical protein